MLLKVLMREPGRIFTRTELCERVWEHEHEYDTKLVEVFIGRLRKKIGEPPLIHTVRHVRLRHLRSNSTRERSGKVNNGVIPLLTGFGRKDRQLCDHG